MDAYDELKRLLGKVDQDKPIPTHQFIDLINATARVALQVRDQQGAIEKLQEGIEVGSD
jgi:hypothetical protein